MAMIIISKTIKVVGILLLATAMVACNKDLYSGLSERDANEMLSVLAKSGISASRAPDNNGMLKIQVPDRYFAQSVDVLKQYGYPREQFTSMGEVFKKEGLISSPLEEKARYIYALSQHISETLTQIDGVITARVNIVLPKDDPFAEEINPASASVFVKYDPKSNLPKNKSDIKLIVEKSIEGISYEKISVVMLPAEVKSIDNIVQPATNSYTMNLTITELIGVVLALLFLMVLAALRIKSKAIPINPFAKDTVKAQVEK